MTNLSPAAQALLSALGCSAASTDQSTPTGCPPTPCRCPAMTEHQHPITPPPELVREWLEESPEDDEFAISNHIATQAARWGADQELEACCEWVYNSEYCEPHAVLHLRAARRSKPPSLKEQALEGLKKVGAFTLGQFDGCSDFNEFEIAVDNIRRALEALDD